MDQQGISQLNVLILISCQEIECLFDSTIITNSSVELLQTEAVFSSLVSLRLHYMYNLQEVFRDPSSRCSLKNLEVFYIKDCIQLYSISFPRNSKLCSLKELRIRSCPMLMSLFMPSIVQTLELLEVLQISECSELKHIIEEVEEGNVSSQSHTSLMLPKLRILDIDRCDRLEYIFPVYFAQGLVSLKRMSIGNCCELKYVFGTEKEHHLSLVYQRLYLNLLNLDTLVLDSLPNLVDICPDYCRPRLSNLKELRCTGCPRLSNSSLGKVVIDSNMQQDTTAMEILVKAVLKFTDLNLSDPGVENLFQFQIGEPGNNIKQVPRNMDLDCFKLMNLLELRFIWKGPTNFLSLQLLKYIRLDGCPKLKTIFSQTIVRTLPVLRKLKILNCEELEQIFDSGDAQELKSLYTCSQQVCFPKLTNIRVQKCNKLKCLFYNFVAGHFPDLTTLKIEECSQLEKIFSFEHEADDDGQDGTGKDGEQVLLQNLRNITLTSWPNFKEIHHGFKLKDYVEQIIKDCPKYYPSLYLHPEKLAGSE